MILEHALLHVRHGAEEQFEEAFHQAKQLLLRQEGCRRLRLARSVESPNTYVLVVEWDTVEAHKQGFHNSPEYPRWKELLHHFYEPFPLVEHFVDVVDEPGAVDVPESADFPPMP